MKYHIITIEREYASGGSEIAEQLAKGLGVPRYGTEILQMAAEKRGTSVDYLEHLEETATGSLLYSLYMMSHVATGSQKLAPADELYVLEAGIIRKLADAGSAVMVGRCASHVLRERNDVLRVFVRADMEFRRHRAQAVYSVSPEAVEQTLRQIDKRRENFYIANTGRKWRDSANYDLVLDSSRLGIARCASVLAACAE